MTDDLAQRRLVRAARSGDRSGFRELVRANQARVYAFALRLTGEEADAMDLTQDVFVEAWRSIARLRDDSAFSTWLHGIAVRKARETWRRNSRRARRETAFAEEAIQRAMPGAAIDLERALQELPPRMRAALILHAIEGLPQQEVARVMGIAEGTVKAHVHTARKLLKEKLDR